MNQGSSEARTLLIEHNMRLVAHIIKKYAFTDKETDDLFVNRNDWSYKGGQHF